MPRTIRIGLLGYGNIGREVFDYFRGARRRLNASAPAGVRRLLVRPEELIADPDIDLIIELTGDAKQGARYILDAIARGKHVVTANKGALAARWEQIMARAQRKGVSI